MAASSLQLIPTEHTSSPARNACPKASSQSISDPQPMAAFTHDMFTVVNNVITSVDFDLGKAQLLGTTPQDLSAVVASLKSCLKGLNWLGTRRGIRLRTYGIFPIGMF